MNHLSYVIVYNPKSDIGNLMGKLSLGLSGVEQPHSEVWSFETTTEITKEYKQGIKKVIRELLIKNGCKLISIKQAKGGE